MKKDLLLLLLISLLISACSSQQLGSTTKPTTVVTLPTSTISRAPVTLSPDTTQSPTPSDSPPSATKTPLPTTAVPPFTPTPVYEIPPFEVIEDIAYAENGDPNQTLSIYLPEPANHKAQTLLLYGGGGFPDLVEHFADLGYPVIAFDIRDDSYLTEIQDGFCALAWAHANAVTYGFDPDQLISVGGSMWGGTAAILGLVDDPIPFLEECPYTLPETGRLRAVIALAGVFDYSEEDDFFFGFIDAIGDYMGGSPDQVPENWAAASAITWVEGNEPPFLLIHGESDVNVDQHQSKKFAVALEATGSVVEFVSLPEINHNTSVTDWKVFREMESYLERLEKADRLNAIGAGTFAFVSNKDGDMEIYLMMIPSVSDGPVVEVQLTHNEVDDSVPDWSPDGEKIAFASKFDGNWEIYLLDVDDAIRDPENAPIRRLTNHEGDDLLPAWSPDGTRIAFASDRDGDWEVYVMQADGTGLRKLTDNNIFDSKPSWSPDGEKISLDSGGGDERTILIMDADGKNREGIIQVQGGWSDWSPDGTRIAYFDRVDGDPEIYVVNVDGTNRIRLTHNSIEDWEPSWSPDGEWLLYVSGQVPDVFMLSADGDEIHRLTYDNFEDWSPVWRP